MTGIRFLLVLAMTGLASAQSGGDAASLVAEVASLAREAKSWHVEGNLVARGSDGKDQPAARVRISFQPPRYARLETSGGDTPLLRVCEGYSQWTEYTEFKGFVRVLLPQIGPCAFPLNAWPALSSTLQSPVLGAVDSITVDGHPRACQTVRGDFTWPGRSAAIQETVNLCIDRQRKLILRYQLQHRAPGPPSSWTYTFSSLERDPELTASLFEFHAPEGSRAMATIDWLTPFPGVSPGVHRVSDEVSAPILTRLSPPVYPAEAALLSGGNTVALHVEIGPDGIAHNVQVSRSLGAGLDEEAVKCVKRWRFQPAMSASGQVAVAATIFVHFMEP